MAVEIATLKPLFPGGNEVDQVWRVCEIMGSPGNAHMSTGAEYSPARRSTSGARYQRVETYVVYGCLEPPPPMIPLSAATLTLSPLPPLLLSTL
jgi:hypothetical protein